MTKSTISLSLSLSLLLCFSFAWTNSANQNQQCEVDCESSQGFAIPSHIEKQGQHAIKEYLDKLFGNALIGDGSTQTGLNKEAYPDSYAIQLENATQITNEGEKNSDADKSDNKPPQKPEEEHHRLIIPSHIEKQGQDAIKKYLDNLFSNALFGSDLTETEQNLEARPDSYSDELHSKTQTKQEDERNMDAHKSSHKHSNNHGKEQLLDDDIEVNVDLEIVGDGEYILKIKKIINPSSTNENEVERAKKMAQNGAMLLHYGEILQDMGEKLLEQSQTSLYSVFKMPAPPKLKSDQ